MMPFGSDKLMPIFINGQEARVPLAQLIAEGREIMARENLPPSKYFDPDLSAASVAVSRYDEARRAWLEANEDEYMQAIRKEARENARLLKASVEAKRLN
jgi:hypothetical protein